jgi:ABC-type nitrate/sulfonate/bicarbonate transport system substrate-binding protein
MQPRRRKLGLALCLAILSLAIAGSTVADGRSVRTAKPMQTIKIAIPVADPLFSQIYVAQTQGFFRKAGVKVTVVDAAGNVVTDVVSGQVDIGSNAPSVPLEAVANGADLKVIYANLTGNGSSFLAAAPSVTAVSQCTSMGAGPVGSQTYIQAGLDAKKAGITANVTPYSDYPTMVASLISGQIKCADATYALFASAVQAGTLHLLVDPRKPSTMPPGTSTSGLPIGSLFASAATIQKKRAALVDFLKGEQRALKYLHTASANAVAADLKHLTDFAQETKAQLAAQVAVDQKVQVYGPNGGLITKATWKAALAYLNRAGTSFNASTGVAAFGSRVDMSLLKLANAATSKS